MNSLKFTYSSFNNIPFKAIRLKQIFFSQNALARIVLTVYQISFKTRSHCKSFVNTVLLSIHYSHFIVKDLLKTNQISVRHVLADVRVTRPYVALHHRSATLMASACLMCATSPQHYITVAPHLWCQHPLPF